LGNGFSTKELEGGEDKTWSLGKLGGEGDFEVSVVG
jgi:hypothetical protein